MQNKTHARLTRTSIIKLMVIATRRNCSTRWKIVLECPINHFRRLPKSVDKVGSSPLDGRSESKPSYRVLKNFDWYRTECYDFLRHIVICDVTWVHRYTSESRRQAWTDENLEIQHRRHQIFLLVMVLQRFFLDCRGISLIHFLYERRHVAYYWQLFNEDVSIRSAILSMTMLRHIQFY